MKAKSQTVPVPPGKTITIWMEFSEIKPRNSDHNSHFAVPTLRCNVRLHPATGISAVALFPRDEGKSIAFETNYTYEKLLLAGQEIRIRWWDTAEFDCGIRGMENDKVTSFTGGDDPELGGAVRMRLPF